MSRNKFAIILMITYVSSILNAAPPKNILFYIGDGMGFEQVESAELYTGTIMSFNNPELFPFRADCTTYSASNSITDSAAGATALATGIKVNNGVISLAIPGDDSELLTLLEDAQQQGKSVGLITTAYLTHATPAAFAAHESSRSQYSDIGHDLLYQTKPNILFGGGGNGLSLSEAASVGYTVTDNTEEFLTFTPDGNPSTDEYFSAQFDSGYMPYKEHYLVSPYPYPLLDEMVQKAIEILSEDPDGFFLMIEGGRIDHAGHSNQIKECVHEVIDLSNAVQTGYDWASSRTDTLILITADHETGGLTVDGTIDSDGYPEAHWTTTGHTAANVPIYAWGVNADMVTGTMDNTDMFNLCTTDNGPFIYATNPFPADDQTNTELDLTLSWTPGMTAAQHHLLVWLGIDPNTVVVDTFITETEYPISCPIGTTYYWAVDEYDAQDNLLATGNTWSFTTAYPPTAPTDLTPDETVASRRLQLSWAPVDNAYEYWIYLDQDINPTTLVSVQTTTTFPPGKLHNSSTYFWKVIAKNPAGQATSETASFYCSRSIEVGTRLSPGQYYHRQSKMKRRKK